ncbi:hypothetical protein DPEC_G00108260 [Dallia pectoralis]|uniref:Uncharacterized protein n=1 Tax=Dallia pectoralis TaxID=75939 RepID=A0ACC2GSY8_DALPE|nr:hypothetical protein DPEC_G00108260 [Dallia pectoralis]
MYITIQEERSLPELERCTTCCNGFHWPFCSSALFHSTKWSKAIIYALAVLRSVSLQEAEQVFFSGPDYHYRPPHPFLAFSIVAALLPFTGSRDY